MQFSLINFHNSDCVCMTSYPFLFMITVDCFAVIDFIVLLLMTKTTVSFLNFFFLPQHVPRNVPTKKKDTAFNVFKVTPTNH